MALGNLSIKVSADVGGFTSNMDLAAKSAQSGMGASSSAVDDFRRNLMHGSADMQQAAKQIGDGMEAANAAIMAASKSSEEALRKLNETASDVDSKSIGDKIAYGIGAGVGAGIVAGQTAWDKFVEYTKTKAIVVGIAVGAIFAAVGLGAIYTAYKVISGSIGFIAGLLTGSSYKSASIDALIKANDQIKEIQNSLYLTAQQAAATDAAIKAIGVSKSDYTTVFTGAATAVRANADELDRLGVKYKDAKGNLLPLDQVVQNANKKLGEYTEGWDRNQAAQAIGLGTSAQVAAAASVTAAKIAEAGARLNDYNLGIGEESQAAVSRYESAMRDFNRESDLTSSGFKRAWADQIMPILTDLAEFFKDGFPFAVNVFRYSMATVTSLFYGLKTVAYMVAESILGSVSSIGSILGGIGVAAEKVLTGDFTGAKDALVSGWTDAKSRLGQIGDNIVAQARHNSDAMRQAWALDDRATPGAKKTKTGRTWVAKPDEEAAAAIRKDPFDTEMANLGRQQASIDYVIANFDKFNGKVKDSKAAMAEFDITMGKFSDKQRKLEEFEPLTAAQKASYIAKNKLIDEGIEKERQMTVLKKFDKSTEQFAFTEQQAIDFRKQDIEWMGKSQVELSKLTEARRIDGQIAAMINATQIELGKSGLTITDKQIAAIQAVGDASKKVASDLIQQADDKSKDPWFNASESLRLYLENVKNTGKQIGNAMTNAFKGMEDALTSFVMTGKLDFKSLADSIIANLVRMQIQQNIMPWLSGAITTGLSGILGFANGGDPPLNRPSIVGENGPELFVPRGAGTIIPNGAFNGSGGSGQTVNVTQNFTVGDVA